MPKTNKHADWNNGVQVGIFQRNYKIYIMIIQDVKLSNFYSGLQKTGALVNLPNKMAIFS